LIEVYLPDRISSFGIEVLLGLKNDVLFLIDHEAIKEYAKRNKEESSKRKYYGYLNKYHN